jgi:hypothetical protein
LRTIDPPSTESYLVCTGLRNRKSVQGPPTRCRATEKERERKKIGKVVPILK